MKTLASVRTITQCLLLTLSVLVPMAQSQSLSTDGSAQNVSPVSRQTAQVIFKSAVSQFAKDMDRVKARQKFLEAVKQDPSFTHAYYNLGILAEADENWDEAVKWLQKVVQLDKTSDLPLRSQLALTRIEKVRELDSTPEGKRNRRYGDAIAQAGLLLRMGLLKEAVAQSTVAAEIDDSRWEAYALIASSLSQQQLYEEAAMFLQRASERAPAGKKAGLLEALKLCRRKVK